MSIRPAAVVAMALALWTTSALAAPTELGYSGQLNRDDGAPFVGDVVLEVALYDAEDATVPVWGPVPVDPMPVIDGTFSLVLGGGSQPTLTDAMTADAAFIELIFVGAGTAARAPTVPNISGILLNGATHSNITVQGMHLINVGARDIRAGGPAADAAVGIFTGVGSADTGITNSRLIDNALEGFGQGLSPRGPNGGSPPVYDLRPVPTITAMDGFEGRTVIRGNDFYLERSAIGVRTHVNVGEGSSHNTVIANDTFEGPLRVANHAIGVVSDSGDPASNWTIQGNVFRAFDVSPLTGGFFGNGTLIKFHTSPAGDPARNIRIVGNTFDDIIPGTDDYRGMKRVLTGHTREHDNVFSFVDAAGTITGTLDSGVTHGGCRVALGGSGVPVAAATKCTGLVTGIVIGANTGEYTVSLARRILLTSFSATASGANAPEQIRLNVPSHSNVQAGYVDNVTLTLLDADGAPVWPSFSSLLRFELGTTSGLD